MGSKTVRADHKGEHRTAYLKNRNKILKTQTVCGICGKPVDFSLKYPDPLSACVDHIIPVSRGGHPSALSNLQLAHFTCNRAKSDKIAVDDRKKKQEIDQTISNRNLPLSMDWTKYRSEENR